MNEQELVNLAKEQVNAELKSLKEKRDGLLLFKAKLEGLQRFGELSPTAQEWLAEVNFIVQMYDAIMASIVRKGIHEP